MGKGGRSSLAEGHSPSASAGHVDASPVDPLTLLAQPEFEPFKQPGFNAAEFTSNVLAGSRTTAQAQCEELRKGALALEGALTSQVRPSCNITWWHKI